MYPSPSCTCRVPAVWVTIYTAHPTHHVDRLLLLSSIHSYIHSYIHSFMHSFIAHAFAISPRLSYTEYANHGTLFPLPQPCCSAIPPPPSSHRLSTISPLVFSPGLLPWSSPLSSPLKGVSTDGDEKSRLAASIGPSPIHTLIMRNHGACTTGKTVGEAWVRLYHYTDITL